MSSKPGRDFVHSTHQLHDGIHPLLVELSFELQMLVSHFHSLPGNPDQIGLVAFSGPVRDGYFVLKPASQKHVDRNSQALPNKVVNGDLKAIGRCSLEASRVLDLPGSAREYCGR